MTQCKWRFDVRLRALTGLLLCLATAAECAGQCQYEVTVIEGPRSAGLGQASLYGLGLNEQGHVVGYFHYTAGWDRPFLWTKETGLIELPLPPNSYEATAEDINDAGQIVGTMTHNQLGIRGFIYENGQYTILPPVIPDAGWSTALAINNHAQVVGYRSIGDGGNPYNAYIWSSEDGFTDLGLMDPFSAAVDISDQGVVLGWTGLGGWAEAFLWEDGHSCILGPIPGGVTSTPGGVNARREVVGCGWVEIPSRIDGFGKAYLWSNDDWKFLDPIPGCDSCGAWDLNDRTQTVGFCTLTQGPPDDRAVLWQTGREYDLNALTEFDQAGRMERGNAINNAGQIIAEGYDADYNSITFLLTPIDPPVGDINGDCDVNVRDLLFLLGEWGNTASPADINGDGIVDFFDLLTLLHNWGS